MRRLTVTAAAWTITAICLCGLSLADDGSEAANACAEADEPKPALPKPPQSAKITFAIHAHDGVIQTLGWSVLKAEFEKRGFLCQIIRSPKTETKTPNQDRAKVMVEALKNVEGDIVLVGISNEGLFMPLVAVERPIRRIVMINAVVPTPGKSFQEAFDFDDVFASKIAVRLAERPRHVGGLPAQGTAEGRVCLHLRRKGRCDTAGMGAASRARVSACRTGRRQRRGPREYHLVVRKEVVDAATKGL